MIHLLAILATFRLTNLLWAGGDEEGPFDLMIHIRAFLCRWDMTRRMTCCNLCVSVWMAGLVGIIYLAAYSFQFGFQWHEAMRLPIYVFGWSGAACLIYILLDILHKKGD